MKRARAFCAGVGMVAECRRGVSAALLRVPQPQFETAMNSATTIAAFLVYAALAGLCGALAMTAAMKLVARSGMARDGMIMAVGSMFTRSRETGFRVGLILHALSAVVFGQ